MRRWLALLLVVVALYGLFEARRLIEGPVITIDSPQNGTATSSSLIVVRGTVHNAAFFTIDDDPAFTDVNGRFSITLSLPSGYTIITAAAVDRFGHRTHTQVDIEVLNYCPV